MKKTSKNLVKLINNIQDIIDIDRTNEPLSTILTPVLFKRRLGGGWEKVS